MATRNQIAVALVMYQLIGVLGAVFIVATRRTEGPLRMTH